MSNAANTQAHFCGLASCGSWDWEARVTCSVNVCQSHRKVDQGRKRKRGIVKVAVSSLIKDPGLPGVGSQYAAYIKMCNTEVVGQWNYCTCRDWQS